jgi:hypothetical protein
MCRKSGCLFTLIVQITKKKKGKRIRSADNNSSSWQTYYCFNKTVNKRFLKNKNDF